MRSENYGMVFGFIPSHGYSCAVGDESVLSEIKFSTKKVFPCFLRDANRCSLEASKEEQSEQEGPEGRCRRCSS